jgi:hypothetical protein
MLPYNFPAHCGDRSLEEGRLELLVTMPGLVHQGLKLGLSAQILQQRVAHEIRITEEAASNAVPQHV